MASAIRCSCARARTRDSRAVACGAALVRPAVRAVLVSVVGLLSAIHIAKADALTDIETEIEDIRQEIVSEKAILDGKIVQRITVTKAAATERKTTLDQRVAEIESRFDARFNLVEAELLKAETPAERQRLQRKLEEILEAQTRLRREKQAVSREIDRKTMMEQVRLMVIRQELEKTAKEFDEWLNAAAEKEKSLPGRMQGPAAQNLGAAPAPVIELQLQ